MQPMDQEASGLQGYINVCSGVILSSNIVLTLIDKQTVRQPADCCVIEDEIAVVM